MPVISDLSLTIKPTTALHSNVIPDANINAYETTTEGRHAIVLDFNAGDGLYARDLGTIFSWPGSADTVLYIWQPSVIPQPETIYGRNTDWLGGDQPGAKFIQGILVTADSFNVAKTFQLQSGDDLSLHSLLEMPATFNKQSQKAFSCVPFVAHSIRIVPSDGVAWRLYDARPVFQSYPELTMNWTTVMTSLGLIGYGHLREMNIPYISTAALTLTLTFDDWPTITITLPSSAGVFTKLKQTIPPNKFKLVQFSLTSTAPFRLFQPEVEVKLGQWGRSDSYKILKPFGGPNSVGAEL